MMTRHRIGTVVCCAILLSAPLWAGEPLQAQTAAVQTVVYDFGLLELTSDQQLTITALNAGGRPARVAVQFMDYVDDSCAIGVVCLHTPATAVNTPEQTLAPDAALSVSADDWNSLRAQVRVVGRDPVVVIRGEIRDTSTGQLIEWITPNTVVRKKPR